ncbi:MAG: bifunctional DNA primase/polymerase [Candidatus Rokubacteria bacterium]|nr:bifunctional DNA primase/polymerase [Candidatus Rokubacteria bacterium]
MTALDVARDYRARGWYCIPIPYEAKRPTLDCWPDLRLEADDLAEHFNGGPSNVGVLLGAPSGDLADVDLDCSETIALADALLPSTAAVFGRASKPRSHRLYASEIQTEKFADVDGTMLVEIRSTGGQTVFPGSTHPSGEAVEWAEDGDPAHVEPGELRHAVVHLAVAALIARHWPGDGMRHETALAAAGFLARAGVDAESVVRIITGAARVAGDPEWSDRKRAALDTVAAIRSGEAATGGPRLGELLTGDGRKVVERMRKWLGATDELALPRSEPEAAKTSQAQRLVALVPDGGLFRAPDGETAFATLPVNTHMETWPVRSKGFRRWLVGRFYQEEGKPPSAQALVDAFGALEARAQFGGRVHDVRVRVGGFSDRIYLDLVNAEWETVEIAPTGWRIITDPPVKFRRARGMQALPHPVPGGSVDELAAFINVKSDEQRALIMAWLVAALRPDGPYPVLAFVGEHGTAKSTTEELCRALIDPNIAMLRAEPSDPRDVMIAAKNGWIIALDNLSDLEPWLSDCLCRLATGGGFATRELYSDDDETIFVAQRPAMLNGIDAVISRPDLLDRAIIIDLPRIRDDRRRPRGEFWSAFEAARPRILGALLTAVSAALRRVGDVRLDSLPRMADFATWAHAAEPALGLQPGEFLAAYGGNRAAAHDLALEASPIASSLRTLAEAGDWAGTAAELLGALCKVADDTTKKLKTWPTTPRTLGTALRRIAPNLRAVGVSVEFSDQRELGPRRRQVSIQRVTVADRSQRSERSGGGSEPGFAFRRNDGPFRRNDAGNAGTSPGNNGNAGNGPVPTLSADEEAEL